MTKIISEILDGHIDTGTGTYTVVVGYRENVLRKGWTNLSYRTKEEADKCLYIGLKIRDNV